MPVAREVKKAETRVPDTRISCHVSDNDKSLKSINQSVNPSIITFCSISNIIDMSLAKEIF